jgi:gliding motility-associated-like protein
MLRRLVILISLALQPVFSFTQDLALGAMTSPANGCYLSSNASVTIVIANVLGAPYGGTFDISYSLNGAPPIVESVTTVLPGSGTYIYTFVVKANVSNCQLHTFDFVLSVPGDVNPANNTSSVSIASDCDPVTGTIAYPDTVCSGINSGNLVLSGFSASVVDWQYSDDGGAFWNSTGNTAPTEPYTNIVLETMYMAIVGSAYGYCPNDTAGPVTIKVVPQSVGGMLPADFDICDNGNGGQIDLTGYTGDILNWEYSQDGGTTWIPIANTTDALTYLNLTDTTMYQVQVQNNLCPSVYSAAITLTLIPGSDAGVIAGPALVCNFENDSSLEVIPVVGSAIDWALSTDGGTTWVNQAVANNIYAFSGLLSNTVFAAIVQVGSCPYDTAFHTVIVLPLGVSAGSNVSIYEEDSTQLVASGGASYMWYPNTDISDPNVINPVVWPMVTTTYFVQVTDVNGCIDTASVIITVLPDIYTIVVPNLLTPNGDGFNDYLSIANLDSYPNNEIHIFNSYGQVIYQASPYNNDWEPAFNGANVPDGTYYYILNLNDEILAPDPVQGVITIIGND